MIKSSTKLFSASSVSLISPPIFVRPGDVVLISGFGIPEDVSLVVLKEIYEGSGPVPDGDACSGPLPTTSVPRISERVSVCCEWTLTREQNTKFLVVPGIYRLQLEQPEALGVIIVEAATMERVYADLAPEAMIFGTNCDCGGIVANIDCAKLQGVFVAGTLARFYGVDATGQCVVGPPPPCCPETPFVANDSNTIDFTTSGPEGHVLTGVVKVSTDAGNTVVVRPDGIYVPPTTETPLQVIDTPTVNLTSTGTNGHTVQADVKISGDSGNRIEVRPDGLFVLPQAIPPETPFSAVDSTTIDFTTSGTLNHVLTGVVRVSSANNNRLAVNPDGLYVPPVGCQDLNAAFSAGTLAQVYGRDAGGNCVFGPVPTGGGSSNPETPFVANDSSTIDFTTSGTLNHVLTGVVRIDPASGDRLVITANGLFLRPVQCPDLQAVFGAGTPVQVYGLDASGNCVRGAMPSSPGSATVDCAAVRALFTGTTLVKGGTTRLLATDGVSCGVVDPCALGSKVLRSVSGPASSYSLSFAQLQGVCGSSSSSESDPIIFTQMSKGWAGAAGMDQVGTVADYWPITATGFPVVAGRVYIVTINSSYPKFGDGPVLGNVSLNPGYSGGAAGTVIDDPYSVAMEAGRGWMSAWIIRATANGTMTPVFSTTGDAASQTSRMADWLITEARTTSGQPATYSEAEQSGTRYALNAPAPNNVLQLAQIPGVTSPSVLFTFGAMKVDDPTFSGNALPKGFSFARGTIIGSEYSNSLTSGGGGSSAVTKNLSEMNQNDVVLSSPGGTSPSGAAIVRMTETATTTYHYLSNWQVAGRNGVSTVFEFEFQTDPGNTHSSNQIRIGFDLSGGSQVATFDTSTGDVAGNGPNVTAASTDIGSGWRRATVTVTPNVDPLAVSLEFSRSGAGVFAGNTSFYVNLGRVGTAAAGGSGGARPDNLALAHVAATVNHTIDYGAYSNDPADVDTGDNASRRIVYKAFRFHAMIDNPGSPGGAVTFHQASTTVCDTDPCAAYESVVTISGGSIVGSIPEDTAYRLIWKVNGTEQTRRLLDNRGGVAIKPIEIDSPMFEVPVSVANGGCATATAEIQIECVKGNNAATAGSLTVSPFRMIHLAYPV